jgi:hypothetical protein
VKRDIETWGDTGIFALVPVNNITTVRTTTHTHSAHTSGAHLMMPSCLVADNSIAHIHIYILNHQGDHTLTIHIH